MRKLEFFNWGGESVKGATMVALIFFNALSFLYALNIYVQFSPFEVAKVFLSFQLILLLLFVFLRPGSFAKADIKISMILIASGVVIFLVLLYGSLGESALPVYVKTLPTLEAQIGLGWHQDTAFHISLVQSIINFGYPSIAQHGHPLTAYHVLSHYIDAAILLASGVDPFESYGLFTHFRAVLFLSVSLLAISYLSRGHGLAIYLISVALLMPMLVGTWHVVLSHGLWVTSLLLVASTPCVVSILYRQTAPGTWEALALLVLIILLSIGKISTGFMFACFVGLWVFIKNPLAMRTIVLGGSTLFFFYLYGAQFISRANNISTQMSFSSLSLSGLHSYMTAAEIVRGGGKVPSLAWQLLLLVFLFFGLFLVRSVRLNAQVFFAVILALLCLWVITEANPALSVSDVWYFQYGLSSVLVLVGYSLVLKNISAFSENLCSKSDQLWRRAAYVLGFAVAVLFSRNFSLPAYNVFSCCVSGVKGSLSYLREGGFRQINSKVLPVNRYYLFESYKRKKNSIDIISRGKDLSEFKDHLDGVLEGGGVKRSQVALFIPASIYRDDIAKYGGPPWASGLLMYAVLGVPLVHGVVNIKSGYGFANYAGSALREESDDFSLSDTCAQVEVREILVVAGFSPPVIQRQQCP